MAVDKVPQGASPVEIVTRADAKARGLKNYYTGKPCKNGHTAERWTVNGTCVVCVAEHKSRWREENHERWLETDAAYRERNRERLREQGKQRYHADVERFRKKARDHYARHPERLKKRRRVYWENNREKCVAYYHRWKAVNADRNRERRMRKYHQNINGYRDKQRQYVVNNRELYTAATHKRRAKAKHTPKNVVSFLKWMRSASKVRCYWCKAFTPKAQREADHIIPLAKGGSHSAANLCVSCRTCNRKKSATMPEVFAAQAEMSFAA